MFGVGQIIQGHYNEVTNKEGELYKYRIEICKKCELSIKSSFGLICDSKKCLDPNTKELYHFPKKVLICGCGCRLEAKTRVPSAKCVLGKW